MLHPGRRIIFIIVKNILLILVCWLPLQLAARNRAQKTLDIPFELTAQHQIAVKMVLNNTDTLTMMFHTAYSGVAITAAAAKRMHTLHFSSSNNKVQSWGNQQNESRISRDNHLRIGACEKNEVTLFEDLQSGESTDGKFGPDFFAGKMIKIDFERKKIVIGEAGSFDTKQYQALPLQDEDGLLFLSATSVIADTSYTHKFLIHSGYNGSLLYDDGFTRQHLLAKRLTVTREQALSDAYGNVIKTKKAILPELKIGNHRLTHIPVGFFEAKLAQQDISVLGADILYRFNSILSADRKTIFLKPNQYFHLAAHIN